MSRRPRFRRPSSIYKNACLRRWNSIRPCLTSPITGEVTSFASSVDECMYVDPMGWTALHKAAYMGAPLDVINALVYTYPPALTMQTNQGWTPLNLACWREVHEDVVSLLLDHCSGCASVESDSGKVPLYCVSAGVRTIHVKLLRKLVLARPSAALYKDAEGRCPVDLVCLEYRHTMELAVDVENRKGCPSPGRLAIAAAQQLNYVPELRDCWEKVSLLVQAAYYSIRNERFHAKLAEKNRLPVRLVHAFCTVARELSWMRSSPAGSTDSKADPHEEEEMPQNSECFSVLLAALGVKRSLTDSNSENGGSTLCLSPEARQLLPFLRFAVLLHPNQLKERDEQGLTPFQILFRGVGSYKMGFDESPLLAAVHKSSRELLRQSSTRSCSAA